MSEADDLTGPAEGSTGPDPGDPPTPATAAPGSFAAAAEMDTGRLEAFSDGVFGIFQGV